MPKPITEAHRRWKRLAQKRAELLSEAIVALQQIRDTAIAMDDSIRIYPNRRTTISTEGPRRIKDAANKVLLK